MSAPALFASQDRNVSDLAIELPRPTFTASVPVTASVSSEDNLRSSLERFNEFERQIAALRSSIATSRPSLLPQMGSSGHAPREDWQAVSSSFQPMSSGDLNAPDTGDESTHSIQDDTFPSISPFSSANGISSSRPSVSSTGSGFYPFQYSNLTRNPTVSSSYSPTPGRPSTENERSGATIGSSSAPPGMASAHPNVGMRQSSGSRLSPPPPPPRLRPIRRSPSPLILEPAVSPSSSDDASLASNGVIDSDSRLPLTHGRSDNISPDNFEIQPGSQVERASPELAEVRHRVLRQHSVERGPTPSVFDVFGIGDSLLESDVTRRSQSPARERASIPVRVPSSGADTRAGPSEFRIHGPNAPYPTNRSNFHSRLYSMPSTNSLMSENAAEQRQTIAREHIWTPFHESSSLDLPGYTSDESRSEGRPLSFTDSPPHSEGFMRSGVVSESGRGGSGYSDEQTFTRRTATLESGSEPPAGRRPENHLGSDPRPFIPHPPDVQGTSNPLAPESLFFLGDDIPTAFETSSRSDEWSPPPISPQHGAQRTGFPYSYDSLNLESFQSGMYRDSLRRFAEVRRPSPVSRYPSWSLDDSDSSDETDFGIVRSRRLSSPAIRERLRAFATVIRSQRNRSGLEPASTNDESNMSRQRQQASPRGPVGPISFSSQNMVRGTQPSNSSATAGARSNRASSPVRFTDQMANTRNQREEGGRRRISTFGHPRPNPSLTPRPESTVVDDEPASRRPFGGGILQRLANFQRPSDGTWSSSSSQLGTRVVPPPLGARPALTRHRSIIPSDPVDDDDDDGDDRPPSMSRNPIIPVPTFEPARRQPITWHPFMPSGRGPAVPDAIPGSNAPLTRTQESAPLTSLEEYTHRHHALRHRAQLDRGGAPTPRTHRPSIWRSMASRRNFGAGDYMPDELFDPSYEALLSLSDAIGEVHSKATPEDVINSLQSATYKEWASEDSEMRCPICLDDYEPSDIVTKLLECPHWLHKQCLEQWLRTANTCPVCRKKVKTSPSPRKACPYRGRSASTAGTSNEAGRNSSNSPSNGSQSNFRIGAVTPSAPFVTPGNLRNAVLSRQQPQTSRAARPVPTHVEMEIPTFMQPRAAREEIRPPGHPVHPDHRHAIYGAIPQHSHVSHHTHIRSSRPSTSRPLPSQVHTNVTPMAYVHRQSHEQRGNASEQLIVPRTPPTDANINSQLRPAFPGSGPSLFDTDGSRPRLPRSDVNTRLNSSEAAPNSLFPPPASATTYPSPPSSAYVTSRADAASTPNSIQNAMAVRSNHQFAPDFGIPLTNTPHSLVHPDPPGHSLAPPQTDAARPRGQDTNFRWQMRSSSMPVRDDASGQNTGPTYSWMLQ